LCRNNVKVNMILIFPTPLQPTVIYLFHIPNNSSALVLTDCWSGQHRADTWAVVIMVGGDDVEATYDHYNYSDTEATYDDHNNGDAEEGWAEGR
jgi:hypothetical protein